MAAKTSMITVRIEADLLEALKKRATEERRSLSAEVVWLLSRAVAPIPRGAPTRRTMGMFADAGFEDLDFEEFHRLRRQLSRRVMQGTKRRRRVA